MQWVKIFHLWKRSYVVVIQLAQLRIHLWKPFPVWSRKKVFYFPYQSTWEQILLFVKIHCIALAKWHRGLKLILPPSFDHLCADNCSQGSLNPGSRGAVTGTYWRWWWCASALWGEVRAALWRGAGWGLGLSELPVELAGLWLLRGQRRYPGN